MKKEYNIPQVEVVIPDMLLMQDNVNSVMKNPEDFNKDQGMAPSRKLYI